MLIDHYERFFIFAAVGLGLFLAGGLNVVLGRSGRRIGLRAMATLAVCGVVAAGFAVLTRPELAVRAVQILAGVLLVVGLSGSAWVGRRVASLVVFVRKPEVRWGSVALVGLVTVLASGFAFDRAEEAETEEGMKELQLAVGIPATKPNGSLHATTDHGTALVLKEPIESHPDADLTDPEGKMLRGAGFADQLIRRAGPSDHANCHGWVFAAGKCLLSPDDVELIIKENDYHETPEAHPGDLVIYRRNGAIVHSAIVRYVTAGQPVMVEGKWGTMGVFLHPADKSFYGTDYTFYHSGRSGHLLVGLGGSADPHHANEVHAPVE